MRLSKRRLTVLCLGSAVLAVVAVAQMPMTTKQGVNFTVSHRRIPAYVKAIDFLHRHYQYKRLSAEAQGSCAGPQSCALAVFEWTHRHLRPMPEGWDVVDDHVLNILIRGYGLEDQMADVYTTLAAYAGIPAFWSTLKAEGFDRSVVLSFVAISGRWVVMDVARGIVFRHEDGRLASLEDIAQDPSIARRCAGDITIDGKPYQDYLRRLKSPEVPHPLRAELQMPNQRLIFEFTHFFSRGK